MFISFFLDISMTSAIFLIHDTSIRSITFCQRSFRAL